MTGIVEVLVIPYVLECLQRVNEALQRVHASLQLLLACHRKQQLAVVFSEYKYKMHLVLGMIFLNS